MKNARKSVVILITIIVVVGCLMTVYSAKDKTLMWLLGEKTKQLESQSEEAIAVVDGISIPKRYFEFAKYNNQLKNDKKSDSEILDELIRRELIYNEALKHGITIEDKELNEIVENTRNAVEQNEEAYNNIKEYIEALGIDENTYWETIARPTYKKMLIRGKFDKMYVQKLYAEKIEKKEITMDYQEYYENYVKELREKAKIEYK